MDVPIQAAFRHLRGKPSRHRDNGHIQIWFHFQCAVQGRRKIIALAFFGLLAQHLIHLSHHIGKHLFCLTVCRNKKVICRHLLKPFGMKACAHCQFPVQISSHADQSLGYSRKFFHFFGNNHQSN